MEQKDRNYRRYVDGDSEDNWELTEKIFAQDTSYKCPTYVHRTPPCQGSCPAGEDIRGWLNIVRGIEKPPAELADKEFGWAEYAYQRSTDANPFPAIMGRVCPAPCEDGCNRNEVEDHVGINAVEHFIGDFALENKLPLHPAGTDTGKKVALIGGGIASLTCAYQLRRMGHACTIYEGREMLGGMMRYGIPGYRTPRDVLDGEIERVLALGVTVKTGMKVGVDIELEQLERDYDAVFVGIGAQGGSPLPVLGAAEATNCISGISFLDAFNDGRLHHSSQKVLVIGGGDTAMDVAAVARRLGHIKNSHDKDRPENVVLGHTAHDVATIASRQGADVTVVYRRPVDQMPATKMEIKHIQQEGVKIAHSLAPIEVIYEGDRATALRVVKADWSTGKMVPIEGSEHDIECDLIVAADELFLGHFNFSERYKRSENNISSDNVLGHFDERIFGPDPEAAQKEADRCMSCGMCFECDNCVIYCPQDAIFRVKKDEQTMGRYVDTDYGKCIGCHICKDVCPSGYIQMGLGA